MLFHRAASGRHKSVKWGHEGDTIVRLFEGQLQGVANSAGTDEKLSANSAVCYFLSCMAYDRTIAY